MIAEGSIKQDRLSAATAHRWWLFLISGTVWMIFALVILQLDMDSILMASVLTIFTLIASAVTEFIRVAFVRVWAELSLCLGILFIFDGLLALGWPHQTYIVFALMLAWYLLAKGVADLVVALLDRDVFDLWWMGLVLGLVEIGLALWISGYPEKSTALLFTWLGLAALLHGLRDTNFGFQLKYAHDTVAAELKRMCAPRESAS